MCDHKFLDGRSSLYESDRHKCWLCGLNEEITSWGIKLHIPDSMLAYSIDPNSIGLEPCEDEERCTYTAGSNYLEIAGNVCHQNCDYSEIDYG